MTTTTQSQQQFGVMTDYEYRVSHKRDRIVVWSGPFYSTFEAEGYSLPNGAGYMLTTYNGDKVRVECPSPREQDNYEEADLLIAAALNAHFHAKGFRRIHQDVDPAAPDAPVTESIPVQTPKRPRARQQGAEEVTEPKPRKEYPKLRVVGLVTSLVLLAVNGVLIAAALTIPLWWRP